MSEDPETEQQPEMEPRVPFWLSVALVTVLSVFPAVYLGPYAIPPWCSFITWAEYFVYGAKPKAIKDTIVPCYTWGAIFTSVGLTIAMILSMLVPMNVDWFNASVMIGLFVGLGIVVWSMKLSETFQTGALALFNGVTMALALFFTNSYPVGAVPVDTSVIVLVWLSFAWTLLAGYIGAFYGWLTVFLQFHKKK